MQPKRLTAVAGFILILAGIALIVVHAIWPNNFFDHSNHVHIFGMKFKTHEIGFGVTALGAILLVFASLGRMPQAN
jgi:hypothetical protein